MKIEDIVKSTVVSSQNQLASNSPVDNQPEEAREPTGCLLRKQHLEPRSYVILWTKYREGTLLRTHAHPYHPKYTHTPSSYTHTHTQTLMTDTHTLITYTDTHNLLNNNDLFELNVFYSEKNL